MNEVSGSCPVCGTTAVLPADEMVLVADEFEAGRRGGMTVLGCGDRVTA